uniref:hypothetical protein n=1 Tax=uncultured Erythrobacter sp. TaxID=263913 RepID=UPI00262CC715|nr:hypothetical protein [uncultured Erythrobacter sp.]
MQFTTFSRSRSAAFALCAAGAIIASSASAQSEEGAADKDNLQGLKACQQITDDAERLACFDNAVGNIVTASETGELRVVDREDAEKTRRSLFGFKLPDIGIFGGNDDDEKAKDELFETTITSARQLSGKKWRFVTAEGAVWELTNTPRRLRPLETGDTVKFKEASMGTYFVRIDGQMGVRGRRIR